jgi:hypothetical protein
MLLGFEPHSRLREGRGGDSCPGKQALSSPSIHGTYIVLIGGAFFIVYYILCTQRILRREPITGSCAKPVESIKEARAGNRELPWLSGYRITSQNTADLKKRPFKAPESRTNTTTKDILALLQIFLHIPFKRSMGLAESLFGKCRNGSPA